MFTVRKSRGVRVLQKNLREETSPYAHWPYNHSVDWSRPPRNGGKSLGYAANQDFYSNRVTQLVETPQAEQGLGVWSGYYLLKGFFGEGLRAATVDMVNASLAFNGNKR